LKTCEIFAAEPQMFSLSKNEKSEKEMKEKIKNKKQAARLP